jgi:hypothetical protein
MNEQIPEAESGDDTLPSSITTLSTASDVAHCLASLIANQPSINNIKKSVTLFVAT